ncbi:hypothetical protein Sinac_7631 (plasmid) [Singulisphaera acidiphila DSM 18658]|uniref:Phage-related minor tail protein n=2 Tax=Singulisphaera acidiphila TaxID=466153 RepID=L0DRQ4_SINAD|nr:hypothetical protein Sinac_7631 [Singulisphaera acidiphila DSM 18658]
MKPAEGQAFLTELYNSGAQFKGVNIGDKEFDQYSKQLAQLAIAKGMSPAETGNLGGTVLGLQDFSKFGDNASEKALGKANSAVSIMGRGKGRNATLLSQFSMLSSSAMNEDEMKGVFTDSDEVATVISVMAEKHDAQAAELAKMAIRGLRGFDKEQGDLLKKAGITAQTKFVDAIKQLAPVVEKEAKERNVKVEDVLASHFTEHGAVDALGVAINKGVSGGVFADREAFAKTVQGPEPALKDIEDLMASPRGVMRQAEADMVLASLERGQENDSFEIVRRQAAAKLMRDKQLDTTEKNLDDFIVNKASFGMLGDATQRRIDQQALKTIIDRAPAGALSQDDVKGRLMITPEQVEGYGADLMEKIRKAKGDPLRDVGRPNLPQDMVPLTAPIEGAWNDPAGQLGGGQIASFGWQSALTASVVGAVPADQPKASASAATEGRAESILTAMLEELRKMNEANSKGREIRPIQARPYVQTR